MNRNPPATPDPFVDTNQYRYLSFRFVQSGNNFSPMRFGWWRVNDFDNGVAEEAVMTRDILIIDGWHTYSVDLWAPDAVDETYPAGTRGWRESHPNRLRFDPNEMFIGHLPVTIQLDWIKLNAMDFVKRGQRYVIQYELAAGRPNSLEFFYDTDRDAGNGRTRIAVVSVSTTAERSDGGEQASPERNVALSAARAGRLYLPMVASAPACSGSCYSWDTSSVPSGTYYIAVRTADAQGATEHYSEAPVIVVP